MFDLRDLSRDTGVLVDAFVRTVDDAPVSPAQDGAQQLRHFSSEKGRPLAMSWGRAGAKKGIYQRCRYKPITLIYPTCRL